MYGLTEAFRSTYLPPSEVDRRPDSMGKAIPNVEVMVVDAEGRPCAPGQEGELVHRGPLVSLGYWNDPVRTAERFKPAPGQPGGLCLTEIAVWSGDVVTTDEDGFLYFVGRRDDMIKTSGNRVSPTEVEEVVHGTGLVKEVAAIGAPHPTLGQGIVLYVTPRDGAAVDVEALLGECRSQLPAFMVPHVVLTRPALPTNANGKIDRSLLRDEASGTFEREGA
jgi:acyl-CoA synthetase (AMP-forming)/AMP-acid ligase II